MKQGRKPTPRNLRLVKGNERKDRENPDEPEVEVSLPDPPDHLTPDEAAVFTDIAGKLQRMKVMSDFDADALAIYAVNHVRWKEANAKVRDLGFMVKSPKGFPLKNPYLSVAKDAEKVCMSLLAEFGMTPSSRTRVRAT